MTLVKNICSVILSGCCVFLEDLLLSVSELWSHSREEWLNVARSQELITGESPNSGLIVWAPHLLCCSNCFDFYGRFLTRKLNFSCALLVSLLPFAAFDGISGRERHKYNAEQKKQGRGFLLEFYPYSICNKWKFSSKTNGCQWD